eukprot:TRINITY_DN1747_c5_g1_i4.p1 TRINITY_DN1747_c5_g1~~TRINITY_DN1747_c5_g1_i4.p1  ORF type:complete len:684 (+),score=123.39 TRINITY_DN1747_c5_g1_i4:211-2052(+)
MSPRSRQCSTSPTTSNPISRDSSAGSFPSTCNRFTAARALNSLPRWQIWPAWRFFWIGVRAKRKAGKRMRGIAVIVVLVGFFFLVNWWMLSNLQDGRGNLRGKDRVVLNRTVRSVPGVRSKFPKGKKAQRVMYGRLLALASHALAEGVNKPEPKDLWMEPVNHRSRWTPCADQFNWKASEGNNGYIVVSANGGINQQRVAICNAVAVARLLNATLVLPNFLHSSVWKDESRFGDIYQEEHFVNYLKADIRIVKELPEELQSLDLEAIGSLVTDEEIMKEAKPSFYLKNILPILLQNRVVHFLGFGNRLAFDPIPAQLQKLRCRCNFHALQFVPKIQETGALLVQRIRQHTARSWLIDHNLFGPFTVESNAKREKDIRKDASRYLALHLRFEIDMAAHSMCYFGGGEKEREELKAYRAIHFPALALLENTTKLPSPEFLRSEGRCPLTPEEAVLTIAALGFNRGTHIYLAGSHIYGGNSRMAALTRLYPNLVTKENLLSPSEIGPFMNFSSQLAALDFIGCAAADVFAMTDSGSQFASLVSGYRMYYGVGKLPTIRPNQRRLADIFSRNATIGWKVLEVRVRKTVKEYKLAHVRPIARSIYRHPRCQQCMCKLD